MNDKQKRAHQIVDWHDSMGLPSWELGVRIGKELKTIGDDEITDFALQYMMQKASECCGPDADHDCPAKHPNPENN
jgi:hypothetical protein